MHICVAQRSKGLSIDWSDMDSSPTGYETDKNTIVTLLLQRILLPDANQTRPKSVRSRK